MQPLSTELILIRVTGEDRPGLTASVTEILAKYDATILDIGQADIHNTLSLGILCKTEEQHSGFIMKELLFKASSLGVTIRFYPITAQEYENWVSMQGKNRYILTLLGRKLSARQISAVTRILAEQGMNIDAIKRLTGRIPLDECDTKTRACIEFSVRGTPKDRIAMQEQLMQLASELEMDFSFHTCRCRRAGKGYYGTCHAWRDRLYGKLPRAGGSAERPGRVCHAGDRREPAYYGRC